MIKIDLFFNFFLTAFNLLIQFDFIGEIAIKSFSSQIPLGPLKEFMFAWQSVGGWQRLYFVLKPFVLLRVRGVWPGFMGEKAFLLGQRFEVAVFDKHHCLSFR